MKRKLLIYETTHYETLPALAELAMEQFEEITIFAANPSIQNDCSPFPVFQNKQIKWVSKAKTSSHQRFIKKVFAELSTGDYSHFFINSLDNNLLYFAIKISLLRKDIHIILNIHCIHDYTSSHYDTFVSTTESIAKKILRKKISHYRVLAPAMPAYLRSFLKKATVSYIPGLFFRGFAPIDFSRDPFQIVIPGTVERKRRTYEQLPEILQALGKYGRKIELVLLGNSNTPYGQYVKNRIRGAIAKLPITFITFDNDVGYDTFSAYYSAAHIVWSPIRRETESIRGIKEINGLSNSAGLIVDFPHYARPAMVPADISFSPEIDALLFRYASPQEAVSLLKNFIADSSVLQPRKKLIEDFCSAYTADRFRDEFNRIMKT